MRLHGGLVLVIVLALAGAFAIYAAWQNPVPGTARDEPASGSLPPVDADPSLVPDIELETAELHVGTIPNTRIFETQFKVFNRGKAPLRLGDVRTSCVCTQGRIPESGRTVPPGGESVVEVMVDPRRIPGFHSRKTLTVFSNDPDEARINIDVVADIEPEFEVVPESIEFGEVPKGVAVSRSILVRQSQQAPFEIRDITVKGVAMGEAAAEDLLVEWRRKPAETWSVPDRAEFEITATVGESAPPGAYVRFLEIRTNVERLPVLPIKVTAEVRAPYGIDPASPRVLAIVATGANPDAKGTVRIAGETQIDIDEINSDLDFLKIAVEAGDVQNTLLLVASVPADAPAGRHDGSIRFVVRADKREYHERIPVRVVVAR